ncbi:MAG: O-antigen ligase family protein [Actinobacteria bacterium]|nr:O-antigen ligase family protein [Actinomycetota bacterium]MCA1720562.1 O-antigen ligase family protein [Actinomycetota bacterium]
MSLTVERWTMAAVVVLTCVLFTAKLADPVNIVKLTVLLVGAIVLLALTVSRSVVTRLLTVPVGAPAFAALLLFAALCASALVAPTGHTAVVGTYGRNSGLLAYAGALVLFVVGLRAWTASTAHLLAFALMAAGLFTSTYGLLQYAGLDSVNWNNPFNPIIAALGNPDFASAYLGICTPAAVWGALRTGWALPWRLGSGAAAVACLAAAALSSAVQGPLAAAAGLAVLAVAWLMNASGPVRRRGFAALAAGAALGAAVLAAGIAKVGPAAGFFSGISFDARTWYWQGALRMFRQHPLLGVGLDHYGTYWRQVRPAASTQRQGGDAFSDSAHSVPLQMLAQGGLLLALAYVFFLVVVALYLVRGLRRLGGQDRLLLGALGGAWAAYVVQSVVSIDQVPLLTVQFATAAGVVGVSGVPTRTLRLPGAAVLAAPAAKGRRQPAVRRRTVNGVDYGLIGGIALIGLVLAWFSLLPLRADAAVHRGDAAVGRGDGTAALADYRHATDLTSGSAVYWGKAGQLLEKVEQPALAYATYSRGVHHDPYDILLLRKAASLAEQQKQAPDRVLALLRRAVELDPSNDTTVIQAAAYATAHGEASWSLRILAQPLQLFPSNADLWAQAGAAYAAAGDTPRSRRAYARALQLNPEQPAAKTALEPGRPLQ